MLVNFFRIPGVRGRSVGGRVGDKNGDKDNWRNFSLQQKRFKGLFIIWHETDWFQSPICHLQTMDNSFYLSSSHANMGKIMVFHTIITMIQGTDM